jgi:uncharacterized protein (DUF2235 family)
MKRIVICADGTWNRPEEDLAKDHPTNVLRLARGIRPVASDGIEQVVFYDWGVGSDRKQLTGGAFGAGLNKNVQDCYRFLVQNYHPGDELFLFGFSRGAYTIRSLAGFIFNCGILRRTHARRIVQAFELYKDPLQHPEENVSIRFRKRYAHADSQTIAFIGVWDTVGALGIPFRMFGFLNEKHLFHDQKIGPTIRVARHALSLDERRDDYKPTLWVHRPTMDLKQVWFSWVHSDVGGGYGPDPKGPTAGKRLSDVPFRWMLGEGVHFGLEVEDHLKKSLAPEPLARRHEEYEGFFKVLGEHVRRIPRRTFLHDSVKTRYEAIPSYRPKSLVRYLGQYPGWDRLVGDLPL